MEDNELVEYIDCTPTWRGILDVLLYIYTSGTEEGKATALRELRRMALAADKTVEQVETMLKELKNE